MRSYVCDVGLFMHLRETVRNVHCLRRCAYVLGLLRFVGTQSLCNQYDIYIYIYFEPDRLSFLFVPIYV